MLAVSLECLDLLSKQLVTSPVIIFFACTSVRACVCMCVCAQSTDQVITISLHMHVCVCL